MNIKLQKSIKILHSRHQPNNINIIGNFMSHQFDHYPTITRKSLYRKRTSLNLVKKLVTDIFKIMNNIDWLYFFSCSSLVDLRFVVGQRLNLLYRSLSRKRARLQNGTSSQWHYLYPVAPKNIYILSRKLRATEK